MKLRDLTGQTFGRLTAIRRVENLPGYGQSRWLFSCSCGNEVILFGYYAAHGKQKSCGCYLKENPPRLKHGYAKTRIFHVWSSMRQRCENKSNAAFKDYGARGIYVCNRWQTFEKFLSDMGIPQNGMTLDRIDNDGPYSPENCVWTTRKQQVRNRRVTKMYSYEGETRSLPEWAEIKGLPYKTVWQRYKNGARGEKLFSTAIRNGGRKKQISL